MEYIASSAFVDHPKPVACFRPRSVLSCRDLDVNVYAALLGDVGIDGLRLLVTLVGGCGKGVSPGAREGFRTVRL